MVCACGGGDGFNGERRAATTARCCAGRRTHRHSQSTISPHWPTPCRAARSGTRRSAARFAPAGRPSFVCVLLPTPSCCSRLAIKRGYSHTHDLGMDASSWQSLASTPTPQQLRAQKTQMILVWHGLARILAAAAIYGTRAVGLNDRALGWGRAFGRARESAASATCRHWTNGRSFPAIRRPHTTAWRAQIVERRSSVSRQQ